jgi:hypothetical protein
MTVKWWHYLSISAFWGPRAASPSEAARQIRSFGKRLAVLDPMFGNLRALRRPGTELMKQQLAQGEPTEAEARRLLAQLEAQSFFLHDISADDLTAELAAQVAGRDSVPFALDFNARPSGARYSVFIGEVHEASEPTPNRISVEIPFANPRTADSNLLSSLLDLSIEAWAPRTCGIYGAWHDPDRHFERRCAYWLHWRAAGVTRESWIDVTGKQVSRDWPEGAPDTSRPRLGGTLDSYSRNRPELMARWAAEGRPPE